MRAPAGGLQNGRASLFVCLPDGKSQGWCEGLLGAAPERVLRWRGSGHWTDRAEPVGVTSRLYTCRVANSERRPGKSADACDGGCRSSPELSLQQTCRAHMSHSTMPHSANLYDSYAASPTDEQMPSTCV